jgi:hypothetical protein
MMTVRRATIPTVVNPASPPAVRFLDGEERSRLPQSLLCALTLHLGLLTLAWMTPAQVAVQLPQPPPAEQEIQVALEWLPAPEDPEPDGSGLPGGGSEQPVPDGPDEASVETEGQIVPAAPQAVQHARVREEGPASPAESVAEPGEEEGLDAEPDPVLAALRTESTAAFPEPVRPRLARRKTLSQRQRAPATSPVVTASRSVTARHRGYGPGAHGGPGGPGRGWGRGRKPSVRTVQQRFAFGGPSGAFRAEVCALPPETKQLGGISTCPGIAAFRTNQFNVSPRAFKQGFPGVTDRTEWFAIKYEGRFETRKPGVHAFRLLSDDGSILYINGVRVIDHDGIHAPTSITSWVRLHAGSHKLKLLYFQGPRYQIALQLFVTPPGGEEKLFGPII